MAAIMRSPRLDWAGSLSPAFNGGFSRLEAQICSITNAWSSHSRLHARRFTHLSSSFSFSSPTLRRNLAERTKPPSLDFSMRQRGCSAGAGGAVCLQEVEELPEALQKIVKKFQMGGLPDNPQTQRLRYQQLLAYATKLKPLPKEHQVPENKVEGCVSQVWVLPTMQEGKVYFQADSDSQLVKGLAALLVEGLSGTTPDQVLRVEPDFIQLLGLRGSLTPSRNNGFLNLLKLMQKKTLQLYREELAQASAAAGLSSNSATSEADDGKADEASRSSDGAASPSTSNGNGNGNGTASLSEFSVAGRPIYSSMQAKLREALSPAELHIEDVSHQHAGHAGVHKGAKETHFNVVVVSDAFEGKSTVKRHRLIYELLGDELKNGLHALSLVTKTPAETVKAKA